MLTLTDITNLVLQWQKDLDSNRLNVQYCEALRKCIKELDNLLSQKIEEELSERHKQYLEKLNRKAS